MIRKMIVIAVVLVALAATPTSAQYGPGSGVEGAGANQGSGGTAAAGSGVDDGSLAQTGSDLNGTAVLGATLIMAGGLAMLFSRRSPRRDLA